MPELNYKLSIDPKHLKSQRKSIEIVINHIEESKLQDDIIQDMYGIQNLLDAIADIMVDCHHYQEDSVYNLSKGGHSKKKRDLYLVKSFTSSSSIKSVSGHIITEDGRMLSTASAEDDDELRTILMRCINLKKYNAIDYIGKEIPEKIKEMLK